MEGKKTVLMITAYTVELQNDEIENDDTLIDKISNDLCNDINSQHTDSILEWISNSAQILDPSAMNCGKCAICGAWTTDQEKEDPIDFLHIGATVDGKLLCDDHLPKDHPLAF